MPYIGNPIYQSAFVTDTFSGDGTTTAFTMSVAPAGVSNVLIAISGVLQDPATYGVVGNTLNFSAAPPSGTNNISCRYLGVPATGVTTTAYRTQTEFTATAGQTTFSVPSYTPGFIDVYRNGALLGSADFVATNGTTVVLNNAASAGDLVEIISFLVSSVLNAIPATAGSVGTANIADSAVTQDKLAPNVAGNGPAFSAYLNASQTGVTASTFTKVTFPTERFDTNNNFASSRFTPTIAGYYQLNASVSMVGSAASISRYIVSIFFNGSEYIRGIDNSAAQLNGTSSTAVVSAIIYFNGTTDYAEIYGFAAASSGTITFVGSASTLTNFTGAMVRAA